MGLHSGHFPSFLWYFATLAATVTIYLCLLLCLSRGMDSGKWTLHQVNVSRWKGEKVSLDTMTFHLPVAVSLSFPPALILLILLFHGILRTLNEVWPFQSTGGINIGDTFLLKTTLRVQCLSTTMSPWPFLLLTLRLDIAGWKQRKEKIVNSIKCRRWWSTNKTKEIYDWF